MFDLKKMIVISLTCLASAYSHGTLTLPDGMLSGLNQVIERKQGAGKETEPAIKTEQGDQLQAYYEWFEEPVYQLVC